MEKKYSISKKKVDKLYEAVHSDILDARIKIAKALGGGDAGRDIDSILYRLMCDAPQNAIDLFEKKNCLTALNEKK